MGDQSKIEWTDATWNPVTGCTKLSAGCKNCYAERMAHRLAGRCGYPQADPFAVTLHPERLEEPLRWRKPRMVFVCSMSDLFHEDVPDEFIASVFAYMRVAHWHLFQVLTKRPKRMADLLLSDDFWGLYSDMSYEAQDAAEEILGNRGEFSVHKRRTDDIRTLDWEVWPIPNVWLGVSCENQSAACERIPHLERCPAAKKFLSLEPLLGETNFDYAGIDWVIVGGESGPKARPMRADWVRSIRDQCVKAQVPFFFKQWGGRNKKAAGRELDGRTWNEMPRRGY